MHDKNIKETKYTTIVPFFLQIISIKDMNCFLRMDGSIDTDERRENNIVLTFRCLIINHFTACAFIVMTLCHFHKWCYILHMVMLNHQI